MIFSDADNWQDQKKNRPSLPATKLNGRFIHTRLTTEQSKQSLSGRHTGRIHSKQTRESYSPNEFYMFNAERSHSENKIPCPIWNKYVQCVVPPRRNIQYVSCGLPNFKEYLKLKSYVVTIFKYLVLINQKNQTNNCWFINTIRVDRVL